MEGKISFVLDMLVIISCGITRDILKAVGYLSLKLRGEF